jgi:polysaccharide export outer membrane protein
MLVVAVFVLLTGGCVTTGKTAYLQEYKEKGYTPVGLDRGTYRIQPNDNLFLKVSTPDPRWSEMFNTIPVGSPGVTTTEQTAELLSYVVQLDGTVDIPYLGSVPVAGKTLAEAKEMFEKQLADYVTDAAITVKLINNYVSVIGEVRMPGRYPVYKEQLTIFEAIAMAGDISDYGNRDKIHVIRRTNEGSVTRELDIKDKSIVDSEFYYVFPNDVIYAEPIKGKFFAMNQFPFAIILSTITTFLLVLSYIQ